MASAAVVCCSVGHAFDPPTVHDNYQSYLTGSRAAGMAGAYTALGCEESAIHYNVAALACAPTSRIEAVANAYALQSLDVPNAFGPGQDVSALNFLTIPTMAATALVLAEGDPVSRAGRIVGGFSVAIPAAIDLDVDPANPGERNFAEFSAADNLTTLDFALGWQVSPSFSIGASVGGGLRIFKRRTDALFTRAPQPCADDMNATCTDFVNATVQTDAIAVGGRVKVGARYAYRRQFSVGLSVQTPTLHLLGSSTQVNTTLSQSNTVFGQDQSVIPIRAEGTSEVGLPLRVALGAAFSRRGFTVSADFSLNFPHLAVAAGELKQLEGDDTPTLSPEQVTKLGFARAHTWQPNVNIGAQANLSESIGLAFGAFTNLSSVDSDDPVNVNADRLHMFGGSVALGLLGRQVDGWFGTTFTVGRASSTVLSGELNLENIDENGFAFGANSRLTRWNLTGFLGSSYSFFDDDEVDPAGE